MTDGTDQFRDELLGLIARHGYENNLKLFEMLGMMWWVMFKMTLDVENEEENNDPAI